MAAVDQRTGQVTVRNRPETPDPVAPAETPKVQHLRPSRPGPPSLYSPDHFGTQDPKVAQRNKAWMKFGAVCTVSYLIAATMVSIPAVPGVLIFTTTTAFNAPAFVLLLLKLGRLRAGIVDPEEPKKPSLLKKLFGSKQEADTPENSTQQITNTQAQAAAGMAQVKARPETLVSGPGRKSTERKTALLQAGEVVSGMAYAGVAAVGMAAVFAASGPLLAAAIAGAGVVAGARALGAKSEQKRYALKDELQPQTQQLTGKAAQAVAKAAAENAAPGSVKPGPDNNAGKPRYMGRLLAREVATAATYGAAGAGGMLTTMTGIAVTAASISMAPLVVVAAGTLVVTAGLGALAMAAHNGYEKALKAAPAASQPKKMRPGMVT